MALKKISKNEKKGIAYGLMLITQVGISMIVPILLCTFIGIWIMKYIDNPIIILISIIVGIIVGFRNIYVMVMSMYSKDKEKEDAEYEYYRKRQPDYTRRNK